MTPGPKIRPVGPFYTPVITRGPEVHCQISNIDMGDNNTIKFINTRVELDFASFKEDIWSH